MRKFTITGNEHKYHLFIMKDSNGNAWICVHGALIECTNLDSYEDNNDDMTFPPENSETYKVKIIDASINSHAIQMSCSTEDDNGNVYAVGYYSNGSTNTGAAIIGSSEGSSGGGGSTTTTYDDFITCCPIEPTTNNTISNYYDRIEQVLTTIRTNALSNATYNLTPSGSTKTWQQVYYNLLNCDDAQIVQFLKGKIEHVYTSFVD